MGMAQLFPYAYPRSSYSLAITPRATSARTSEGWFYEGGGLHRPVWCATGTRCMGAEVGGHLPRKSYTYPARPNGVLVISLCTRLAFCCTRSPFSRLGVFVGDSELEICFEVKRNVQSFVPGIWVNLKFCGWKMHDILFLFRVPYGFPHERFSTRFRGHFLRLTSKHGGFPSPRLVSVPAARVAEEGVFVEATPHGSLSGRSSAAARPTSTSTTRNG